MLWGQRTTRRQRLGGCRWEARAHGRGRDMVEVLLSLLGSIIQIDLWVRGARQPKCRMTRRGHQRRIEDSGPVWIKDHSCSPQIVISHHNTGSVAPQKPLSSPSLPSGHGPDSCDASPPACPPVDPLLPRPTALCRCFAAKIHCSGGQHHFHRCQQRPPAPATTPLLPGRPCTTCAIAASSTRNTRPCRGGCQSTDPTPTTLGH